jgi:molybdopterin-containing oxidoreductase family membrane subunit
MAVMAAGRGAESAALEGRPETFIQGKPSYGQVTSDIAGPLECAPGASWWGALLVTLSMLGMGIGLITYTIMTGIGVWGLNRTVGWGWAITNFVFWIGIGHAGTLISAILLLFRQRWRTSIARAAEAMTIFAVMCAGIFPLIHMGRPWLFFWFLPYPNSRGDLWINFRSPLMWDMFAIGTYFTVSLLFWYIGLIPDFATLRDRTSGFKRRLYAVVSLGWNGSSRTWQRYDKACLMLAALATPLVVSVHTIVSFDFATSVIPGWHTTIFPPYFVAGAVFSGFAMVLTLLIITRKVFALERYITARHLENMAKVLLTTGMLVGCAYGTELFMAWYSGNPYERFTFMNRAFGPYAPFYWTMVFCNVIVPQIFWSARARHSVAVIFVASIFVNIGMWLERFNIVVTSLSRDYLPSSWSHYTPTLVEVGIFVGTFGLFFTCYLLFVRIAPVIAFHEVKHTLSEQSADHGGEHA